MIQIRRSVLLLIFALCMISCSKKPSTRISVTRTPIPEKIATAIAFESIPAPDPTATPEPAPVPSATPEAPAGPDVNAIISKSMSMMAGVGTFHFAMDRHFFSENEADEMSVHIPVRGKFNAPDSIQGTVILTSNETTAVLDFIIIGEELYLREQNSDAWLILDWQSNAAQVVRENAFLPLELFSMENFHEPVLVGEARLGGLPVYHIRGGVGILAEGQTIPAGNSIEIWIGKENHLIYRIISEMATQDSELAVNGRSKLQVDYASFGDPVLIVAPRVDTSGGFRPTGTYDFLNSASGGADADLPADQVESAEPAVEEVASGEDLSSAAEDSLD